MCFSFLELAPWNFRVDEPEEVSSDVVEISSMSQLLVLLIFLKKVVKTLQKNVHYQIFTRPIQMKTIFPEVLFSFML